MFESHPRQLIFLRKSDCHGCAVLLCLVCLFDLACFFLSSFSSLIKTLKTCTCVTPVLQAFLDSFSDIISFQHVLHFGDGRSQIEWKLKVKTDIFQFSHSANIIMAKRP